MLFLDTFQPPYYIRLLPIATRNFADMTIASELVDHAIKNSKIEANEDTRLKKRNVVKKKEEKTHAILLGSQSNRDYAPYYPTINNLAQTHDSYRSPKSSYPEPNW